MKIGKSVLDIVSNKDFLKKVKKNSQYFHIELNKIKDHFPKIIKEIRGKGFLIGMQLPQDYYTLVFV